MLVPEVALRFRSDDEDGEDAIVIAVTSDPDLIQRVARALLTEAEAAAEKARRVDPMLSNLLEAEAQRLSGVCRAVGAERQERHHLRLQEGRCTETKTHRSDE